MCGSKFWYLEHESHIHGHGAWSNALLCLINYMTLNKLPDLLYFSFLTSKLQMIIAMS